MNEKNQSETTLRFAATVVAFLFFFEAARELLGATYNMNLATMSVNSSVVAVFAFCSPIVYLFGLGRLNTRMLVVSSGVALAVCRVFMAVNPPIEGYLLLTVCAVISFGIFLPAMILQFRAHPMGMAPLGLVCAVTVGAGADLVFRALGDTFDITVYGVTAQRVTALVVVLPLVVVFVAALLLWYSNTRRDTQNTGNQQKVPKFRAIFGFSLGAMFFFYTTLLGYPNNVARWIAGSYSLAAVLFGAALGGFVLVLLLTKVRKWLTSDAALITGSVVFLLSVVIFVGVSTPLAVVISALTLFFFPVLLGAAVQYLMQPGITIKQIGAFLTVAAVTLVVLLLLSVFSLTWAFVPGMGFMRDQMGTLLIVAGFLLLLGTALFRYYSGPGVLVPSTSKKARTSLLICGILIIAGTWTGAAIYQSHPVPTEETLTVMTYNIHQGYNTEGKINPWEILEPIRDVNPDILALQESDMNRVSGTNVDIVQWLAHKLDMYVYFGPETKYQIYGVAILSKFPLSNTETYYLKSIEDQRVLIRADIQWEGQPLSIYAVHMGLSEEDRTNQTHEILEIIQQNPNPKLLMGDLNSTPNSKQIIRFVTVLNDAWTSAGNLVMDPLGYTADSLEPSRRIDYIMVSKELAYRINHCEVIRGVYGSDHLPVWAEIEIKIA